jgi:RNA polymerase sigma-70 factor (ECF subfamily)
MPRLEYANTETSTTARTAIGDPARIPLDEELWHGFQNGDESCFTAIYQRYSNRVYAYIRLLLATAERSQLDDVFQDTWIKIYQQKDRFEIHPNSSLSGWIFRLAHNTTVSLLRKTKHLTSLDDAELSEDAIRAVTVEASSVYNEELTTEQMMSLVLESIDKLPLPLREVFLLSEIDHASLDTISETLGISRTNAKVRLFRARKLLREILSPMLDVTN